MSQDLLIRPMTRGELDEMVALAAVEGWNPGLADAEIFWNTDPEGYLAAELAGEMIGGGSIVSYGTFGFMGFFIVKPRFRGKGLGTTLWFARKERLLARLEPPGAIGMDGVFDMQPWYARGGFELACRDLRYQGVGRPAPDGPTVPLSEVPFEELLRYDTAHFPAPRQRFLEQWIAQPGGLALGVLTGERLSGYGVARACREGYKIGPLFADTPEIAGALFDRLAAVGEGQPVYLDVPEINTAAVALAEARGMSVVFGCARMYHGPAPELPTDEIYGVTTFELG